MTLPARLIAHAECHESQPELMSDPEQRQWAADLREAAGLVQAPAEELENRQRELLAILSTTLWVLEHPEVNAIKFCGSPRELAQSIRRRLESIEVHMPNASDATEVFGGCLPTAPKEPRQ